MRWRLLLAVGGATAVAVVAVKPGPLLRVFPRYAPVTDHLPGRRLDTSDPIYFHVSSERPASVNTAAIRRAGELVPDDAIFYVRAPSSAPSSDEVMLAAQLFLLPAIQSRRPDAAGWILSYRAPLPAEPSGRVYELDGDLHLTKVRRG
jgi:hypothetical protein